MKSRQENRVLDEDAVAAVNAISKFINYLSFPKEDFVAAVMKEHRTLQQCMCSLFLNCILEWGDLTENQYDARNEWTVKVCREIKEHLAKSDLVYITKERGLVSPFI